MSHFLKSAVISTLLATTISPIAAYSWNATGHMVIANIAYQKVDPVVKKKIDYFVSKMHQEYPEINDFVGMASWADAIRSQKIEMFTHWHYIDVAFSTDGSPLKNLEDTDNAVYAMKDLQIVLKNDRANDYERARFLAFFEHVVGDLHQPLHTVSDISAQFPNGDRGGNSYTVRFNNSKSNLHSMWDCGLGAFSGSSSPENVKKVADAIMQKYPVSYFGKRADDLSLDTMTAEGMDNAKRYVYDTPYNENVSDQYVSVGEQVAEQQAAIAGYRLAKLLNMLFQ